MNRRNGRRARALDRLTQRANVMIGHHAESRAAELGFSHDDVLHCVWHPEQTYVAPPKHGPDRRIYQRGDIAVVVSETSRVVVTVLLRTRNSWTHGVDTRRSVPR